MGKVVAIAVTILVLVIFVLMFLGWYQKFQARQENKRTGRAVDGDLNAKQEKELLFLLDEAHEIFTRLGHNPDLNDPEIIRDSTRTAIAAWTANYRKVK